ncbi:formyl transferase [Cercophora newfieldiana]|uniref:methionyl-tRNA formyltransferase n=1 Tax=Cercophora newfieldiana TaxID=92897 RepID=A0AA39YFA8_9PEZI|nr:formyl transferase [Cercophora newfieldiana]
MGRLSLLSALRPATRRLSWLSRSCYSTQRKISDPLRILFCGSDEFSCASLRALHEEHQQNSDLIRSIDVVVRPPKLAGRGNKVLREVPVRALAKELELPVHERDTFTKWNMPKPDGEPINLIIAVSFGLFVPRRLLRAAKYGGLNVHPSFLPDLRGPAPLHHALLLGRSHIGTSLQTLSEETFDAGTVLAQTPRPGIAIPHACTLSDLHALITPPSASMLVEALRAGLHVPPHTHAGWEPTPSERSRLAHAPKVTTADKRIRLGPSTSAAFIERQARTLGSLWTTVNNPETSEAVKRITLDNIVITEGLFKAWVAASEVFHLNLGPEAVSVALVPDEDGKAACIQVCEPDGIYTLRIGKVTVEGKKSQDAWSALQRFTEPSYYDE